MVLKINYTIDKKISFNSQTEEPEWQDGDEMLIDYVHVYGLRRECETIEYINNATELQNFDFALKKEIYVCPNRHLTFPAEYGETFRAVKKISLNNITIPQGSRVSFIMQDCEYRERVIK